jgi:hypothetical protein
MKLWARVQIALMIAFRPGLERLASIRRPAGNALNAIRLLALAAKRLLKLSTLRKGVP